MKLIKEETFISLSEKAQAYDNIVKALTDSGNLQTEEITAENILSAMSDGITQARLLETANEEITSLKNLLQESNASKTDLQTQVDNLLNSGAETTATVNHKNETGATEEDIAVFADKHAGDTLSIANEMKKRGLV